MARYRIDPSRSLVRIEARSNVHPIHSEAKGLEGYVELEHDGAGGVDLSIPAAGSLSFRVANLSSPNSFETRELQRRVEARRFPTIDGVLVQMSTDGAEGGYKVSGDLTFRGVTRRYEDRMTVEAVDASTIRLRGSSTFDIRDFDMQPPRVLMLRVEPEVTVSVEIVAEKDGVAAGKEG